MNAPDYLIEALREIHGLVFVTDSERALSRALGIASAALNRYEAEQRRATDTGHQDWKEQSS